MNRLTSIVFEFWSCHIQPVYNTYYQLFFLTTTVDTYPVVRNFYVQIFFFRKKEDKDEKNPHLFILYLHLSQESSRQGGWPNKSIASIEGDCEILINDA